MMEQIKIHRLPGRLRTYTAVSGAILFATSGLFLAYGDWAPSGYRSVDPPVTTAVPAVARFAQRYYVSPKGNNTVFNNGYGGILIGAGDDPSGLNDHTVVANNIVYRNGLNPKAGGYGIKEFGKTGTHNHYHNNLVYQNGPANWHLQNGNKSSGDVSADPQFVNYTGDSTGDYHLQSISPALEKGTDWGTPTIGFGAREKNSKRNLGAYRATRLPSE